jgi:outer membrane receptor protein involved in Fe transport
VAARTAAVNSSPFSKSASIRGPQGGGARLASGEPDRREENMSIALAMAFLALSNPQGQDSPCQSAAPAETTVSGVTIRGSRPASESLIDRRSYAVDSDLQAQTGAIADALRNIPSVQIDPQGGISLRGNAHVVVLVDGKPSAQFSGEALAQTLLTLPANQIDRIEVMTNPSAEFRADGSGGIINLVMKKAKGAGRTASIRAQAATGDRGLIAGNVGYKSGRSNMIADLSYRRDKQMLMTVNEGAAGPQESNTDVLNGQLTQDIFNGHVGIDYDLSAATQLSGGIRLALFHGEQPSLDVFAEEIAGVPVAAFTRASTQEGRQHNSEVSASLRHIWTEERDLNLTATWSTMKFKRHRADRLTPTLPAAPDQTSVFDRRTHNDRLALGAAYQRDMPGSAKLKLGYDFDYSSTRFEHGAASDGAPDPSQSGVFLDDETRDQVYGVYERAFGKLDILMGLRADVLHLELAEQTRSLSADHTYDGLFPSLHLNYDLSEGRKLLASYSRRIDRPSYALLDPVPYPQNPGFVLRGDMDLRPQSTDSTEFGFETRKDSASFSATLYHRQTRNAFSSLYTNLPDGTLLQQLANAGRQTTDGLEITFAKKLTPKLDYNFSADAYWSELAAPNLGLMQTRHAFTAFGRGNLNWRLTEKDFLQFNVFVNGKTLLPQGYVAPFASGNIGYRHAITSNASLMFVIQDPFQSVRTEQVLTEFGGVDRRVDTNNSRMASVTLVWNFSGKPQNPDFDFKAGGYGGAAAP